MWAQIVFLVIVLAGLVINIMYQDEPTERNFDTMNYIMRWACILFLLYKGGFFNCFFHAG